MIQLRIRIFIIVLLYRVFLAEWWLFLILIRTFEISQHSKKYTLATVSQTSFAVLQNERPVLALVLGTDKPCHYCEKILAFQIIISRIVFCRPFNFSVYISELSLPIHI